MTKFTNILRPENLQPKLHIFQSDIEFLKQKMELALQDLSSYDEYVTEVRSGRLEW